MCTVQRLVLAWMLHFTGHKSDLVEAYIQLWLFSDCNGEINGCKDIIREDGW